MLTYVVGNHFVVDRHYESIIIMYHIRWLWHGESDWWESVRWLRCAKEEWRGAKDVVEDSRELGS